MVWLNAYVIRRWVDRKAYGMHVCAAQPQRLRYPVHAVHQAAVGAKDDGPFQAAFIHQFDVLHNSPRCGRITFVAEPVWLVQFSDGVERHLMHGQCLLAHKPDQPVHIPRPQALGAGAKMVLTAQAGQVVRAHPFAGSVVPRGGRLVLGVVFGQKIGSVAQAVGGTYPMAWSAPEPKKWFSICLARYWRAR